MKKIITTLFLGLALTTAIAGPAQNISARKHPNMAAAQKFLDQAYGKVNAAQKANEYDLDGHAAKAKGLIEQASAELKLAAIASNQNKK